MKKYLAIGISVVMAMAATGQAKIPADFWSFPMKGINPVLAELYAATQGQSLAPFSIDPTPDILFNKIELKSVTQMDGTVPRPPIFPLLANRPFHSSPALCSALCQ